MANIVIFTSGTLGDHLPFVALGRALADRGHRVRLALNRAMVEYARRAGLETVTLTDVDRGREEAAANAWAWDHWNHPDLSAHPNAKPLDPAAFLAQIRELAALCRGADLLLATSIRVHGFLVHAATGVPWLTVSMNPYSFWQPRLETERAQLLEGQLNEYRTLRDLIAYSFTGLGLQREQPPFRPGYLFAPHILVASSRHFSRPSLNQLQPWSSLEQTGFWFYEDPEWRDWQPDEALRCFCERRPLVLSFSSQPLEDPRRSLELHVRAAARLGLPLLVQQGWAGFSARDLPPDTPPDQVLFADFLPHDWLFARASAAIQHGGIGSIARAVRQGCPLLVEPYGNDQLYNASRVADLGVGAPMHPFRMTAEGLAKVLGEQVLSGGCRRRAERLGAAIRSEDGLGRACALIETSLARPRAEASGPGQPVPSLDNPHPPPLHRVAGAQPDGAVPPEPSPPEAGIPRILHQTWRDAELPADLAACRQSWLDRHPGWIHYLWTDPDNREFLRRHYPWFLPVYDGYPEAIMRADAARYFILHHYGGVYADLDFQCLQALEPLLEGRQAILGLEPPEHSGRAQAREAGLTTIVANAWMASTPRHPFWPHVFQKLLDGRELRATLDATGPFMLTRAWRDYPDRESIHLVEAARLYPVSVGLPWWELSAAEQARIARTAYAVHHWRGSWWESRAFPEEPSVRAWLVQNGHIQSTLTLETQPSLSGLRRLPRLPLVSCLMVTRNRPELARRALRCFQKQTYAQKELVVLDQGDDDRLQEFIRQLGDERIVHHRVPGGTLKLGALRNLSVARASGDYLAQWDDDDLSAPHRLELQVAVLLTLQADACLLQREYLWDPARRRLAISCARTWENSMLWTRDRLPPFPELDQGEDTAVVDQVVRQGRVALLDSPGLYIYICHGGNIIARDSWDAHWQAATESFREEAYEARLGELAESYRLDLAYLYGHGASPATGAAPAAPSRCESPAGPGPGAAPGAAAVPPAVLVLVPVKDAERYLPRFVENLRAVTYPHSRLSLAFLESDSRDGTFAWLQGRQAGLSAEFNRVSLFKRDYGLQLAGPRWEAGVQYRRRSVLARSRNTLLAEALRDEAWVLWIDVDVARWPPDVIERLLAAGRDIVVPNCLAERTGEPFDLNTFKLKPGAEGLDWSPYLVDGLLQPPRGFGRLYLTELRQFDCVEVDGVGGTMLLVRADLHREGLMFPPFSYRGYIETEGLAQMARDMGHRCWGLPGLEIFHP